MSSPGPTSVGMHGPEILARTLSVGATLDKFGNKWQYHSRSDRHSKAACWCILFDLLANCQLLASQIRRSAVGFGINHPMRDFETDREKYLDLVLCTPGSDTTAVGASSFRDLVSEYGIVLNKIQQRQLDEYPELHRVQVGMVHVALEAKATMTAHIKALPRLHDELDSSHLAIHGASDRAIAAGFAIINMSTTFVSPSMNKFSLRRRAAKVNQHRQPQDTIRTIEKIRQIRRRSQEGIKGFDAIGIVVINLANDGSPVEIVTESPAPDASEIVHYDQMVRRIAHLYESRFANV